MNEAFIKKMVEAKRMEAEAYAQLLPGSQNPHLKVIRNELKVMRNEIVRHAISQVVMVAKDCYTATGTSQGESDCEEKSKTVAKVRKVTIE